MQVDAEARLDSIKAEPGSEDTYESDFSLTEEGVNRWNHLFPPLSRHPWLHPAPPQELSDEAIPPSDDENDTQDVAGASRSQVAQGCNPSTLPQPINFAYVYKNIGRKGAAEAERVLANPNPRTTLGLYSAFPRNLRICNALWLGRSVENQPMPEGCDITESDYSTSDSEGDLWSQRLPRDEQNYQEWKQERLGNKKRRREYRQREDAVPAMMPASRNDSVMDGSEFLHLGDASDASLTSSHESVVARSVRALASASETARREAAEERRDPSVGTETREDSGTPVTLYRQPFDEDKQDSICTTAGESSTMQPLQEKRNVVEAHIMDTHGDATPKPTDSPLRPRRSTPKGESAGSRATGSGHKDLDSQSQTPKASPRKQKRYIPTRAGTRFPGSASLPELASQSGSREVQSIQSSPTRSASGSAQHISHRSPARTLRSPHSPSARKAFPNYSLMMVSTAAEPQIGSSVQSTAIPAVEESSVENIGSTTTLLNLPFMPSAATSIDLGDSLGTDDSIDMSSEAATPSAPPLSSDAFQAAYWPTNTLHQSEQILNSTPQGSRHNLTALPDISRTSATPEVSSLVKGVGTRQLAAEESDELDTQQECHSSSDPRQQPEWAIKQRQRSSDAKRKEAAQTERRSIIEEVKAQQKEKEASPEKGKKMMAQPAEQHGDARVEDRQLQRKQREMSYDSLLGEVEKDHLGIDIHGANDGPSPSALETDAAL